MRESYERAQHQFLLARIDLRQVVLPVVQKDFLRVPTDPEVHERGQDRPHVLSGVREHVVRIPLAIETLCQKAFLDELGQALREGAPREPGVTLQDLIEADGPPYRDFVQDGEDPLSPEETPARTHRRARELDLGTNGHEPREEEPGKEPGVDPGGGGGDGPPRCRGSLRGYPVRSSLGERIAGEGDDVGQGDGALSVVDGC